MTEPDESLSFPVADPEPPTPKDALYGYALPGRRLAVTAVTCLVLAFIGMVAVCLPQFRSWVVPLCLSLVPLLVVALVAAVPLAAIGKDDAPVAPLLAGWLIVVGGAACDTFATVTHSPDLGQEANPVLRGLLDNGVPLAQVYLFGAVLQVLFIGLAMVLWLGLLKHRRTLVATMPPRGSLLAYFKAGTGGRELNYRQWCFPLAYSEFPWAYHFAWWTGVAFIAMSAYRFYVALEWYGVAPTYPLGVRFVAPSLLLFVACRWYAVWLRGARACLGPEAK
jgi:hypothetical protein